MKLRGSGLFVVSLEVIEGKAPAKIKIMPIAPFTFFHVASMRRVDMTQKDQAQMLDYAKRHAAETMIDWRHESMIDLDKVAGREAGKAYGWVDLASAEIGADGIYAPVRWTKRGAELIENGEAGYLSPVFAFNYPDPKTGSRGAVILSIALTNNPNLTDQEPLYAALEKNFNHTSEEYPMNLLELLIALCEKRGIELPEKEERNEQNVLAALEKWQPDNPMIAVGSAACEALALSGDAATPGAVTAGIAALKKDRIPEVLANALNVAPDAVDAAVAAARKGVASEDLAARLEALEAEKRASQKARIDGVIVAAEKAGKIKPERRDYWVRQLEADFDGALATLSELGVQVAALSSDLPPADAHMPADQSSFIAWCQANGIDAETAETIARGGK